MTGKRDARGAGRQIRAPVFGGPGQCKLTAEVIAPGSLLYSASRLRVGGEPAYRYLGVSSFAERVVVPESGRSRCGRRRQA
jgi:S-(hydroxymethyl)glutathione dehydrogenase/alcohol dehydrogenase